MIPTILFLTSPTDNLSPEAREILSSFEVVEQQTDDDVLKRSVVLMSWPSRTKREVLSRMTSLKMIQVLSAGVDALDFTAIPKGVEVCSNAGAYTDTAAEHAWGLALGIAKGIHSGKKRLPPRHLRSRVILVVGCGAIGSEVARLAQTSLGMATIGVSRSFRSPELFSEKFQMAELGSVVGRADLIVNALPLTRSTRAIFTKDILARTKETVIIVNIGRGETVDERAMIEWLRERPDSRYATDVFWKRDGKEIFDSEIWEFPNFGGTKHTASAQDPAALVHAQVAAAMNVKRFLETGSANNRVDVAEYLSENME